MLPLDYLLGIVRDKDQDARSRLDAAKAAAPYRHGRLSSTELSGPNGGPVSVLTTQKIDVSLFDDEELDILERALRKTIALQDECLPKNRPPDLRAYRPSGRDRPQFDRADLQFRLRPEGLGGLGLLRFRVGSIHRNSPCRRFDTDREVRGIGL